MKGLLLRNLYSLRIPVLIVAAAAVLFSFASRYAFIPMYIAMGYLVIRELLPQFEDEKSGFAHWRLTMPVSRKTCVHAAYLTVLTVNAAVLLLLVTGELAYHQNIAHAWYFFGILPAVGFLMPAVFLPLTIRFGRFVGVSGAMIVLVLYLSALPLMRVSILMVIKPESAAAAAKASASLGALLPGVSVLIFFGLSWLLSRRMIEKREF